MLPEPGASIAAYDTPRASPPRADCGLTRTWAEAGSARAESASIIMAARDQDIGLHLIGMEPDVSFDPATAAG
jgi:hypothetical protein